jgi:hypothetical protein
VFLHPHGRETLEDRTTLRPTRIPSIPSIRRGIKSFWDRLNAVAIGAFGLFLLISWAIFPVPTPQDLTEVSGALASYSIEADQSWFARHARGQPSVYVLFKIADQPGRFWSDAVDPGNVRSIFPHPGVALNFYHRSTRTSGLINGDGEKTYGLTVDGAAGPIRRRCCWPRRRACSLRAAGDRTPDACVGGVLVAKSTWTNRSRLVTSVRLRGRRKP